MAPAERSIRPNPEGFTAVFTKRGISKGGEPLQIHPEVYFLCAQLWVLQKNPEPKRRSPPYFDRTLSRGPDQSQIVETPSGYLCFHRLAIMGLDERGMQPFSLDGDMVVCNGELYGFRKLKAELESRGYTFRSGSDCELLLPLYREYGLDMFARLDAEFALILYDSKTGSLIAARDPIGIRPLFYGYDYDGGYCLCQRGQKPYRPVQRGISLPARPLLHRRSVCPLRRSDHRGCVPEGRFGDRVQKHPGKAHRRDRETAGRRRPSGLSSLRRSGFQPGVCAIAAKILGKKIRTFAIGMDVDAIDLKYAREVADFIGSDHTEVIITKEDVLKALPEVVAALGTYDITTIRASMGMYLVCKAIHEQTDVRVLLTGEISDELFGYKYTDFAPSPEAFQQEAKKRVDELYMYDVLRADRCISVHSIEARVPFGDLDFVKYVMGVGPRPEDEHLR